MGDMFFILFFILLLPTTFELFGFPISWLWTFMMNAMSEFIRTNIIRWITNVLSIYDVLYI
jgi:hypothetical protein